MESTPDFTTFDYDELLTARDRIEILILQRQEEVREQFRSETLEKAKKLGLDPLQVLGSIEVKYRDPANPQNTWAGKGRKPQWLQAYINEGHDKEDYAV